MEDTLIIRKTYETYTIKEAATVLNQAARSVYRYVSNGYLKKVGDNQVDKDSVLAFKNELDESKYIVTKGQLANLLRIPESVIGQYIKDGLIQSCKAPVTRRQNLKYYNIKSLMELHTVILKDMKLYPDEREFVHPDYQVALFQQLSFEGFPEWLEREEEDNYRDNVYMTRRNSKGMVVVVGNNFVPVDRFFEDYKNINPVVEIDTEKRMTKTKTNAVHLFIPFNITDSFTLNSTSKYKPTTHGLWAFPLVNFFYETWGIKNCGVRIWKEEPNEFNTLPDEFEGGGLPYGDKIVQISIKPAVKAFKNPIYKDLFEKNMDQINSFAIGGKLTIVDGNLQVTNDKSIATLADLKNIEDFKHKGIFNPKTLLNSLIQMELIENSN